MIVIYIAMPGLSAGADRDFSLVSSVLLLPANAPPALSVAWTLVHELMFYGVFLLFFVQRCWLVVGLLVWALVIVLADLFIVPTGWLSYPLSLLNIEFMLGVGAAWLVKSRVFQDKGPSVALLGSGLVCLAIWMLLSEDSTYFRLLLALGLALVIVGFAMHEQKVTIRWPALFLLLGNASYSIYLVHNPLLSITQRVAGSLAMTWSSAMVWGVMISLLAGWIYYLVIERPALRLLQNWHNVR